MSLELDVGQLVVSTAGRDDGALYVVTGQAGPGMVLVADGRRRPMDRPKRKNTRHLQLAGSVGDLLGEGRLTNERIRTAIELAAGGHYPAPGPSGDGG